MYFKTTDGKVKNTSRIFILIMMFIPLACCSTAYRAKPLPVKAPTAYPNTTEIAGTTIGAQAYVDKSKAADAFGFDVRGAGMLPVQVVFDNQGTKTLSIKASQTFLEDNEGNLWPLLSNEMAYERATKYAQTEKIFKEGAYGGFLGGAAGAVIGAAIGIISGEDVASSAGKGAAVGAAAGGTLGGGKAYASGDARQAVINDLKKKALEQKAIEPNGLSYGFLFFPGEAKSAKKLRMQITERDSSQTYNLTMGF